MKRFRMICLVLVIFGYSDIAYSQDQSIPNWVPIRGDSTVDKFGYSHTLEWAGPWKKLNYCVGYEQEVIIYDLDFVEPYTYGEQYEHWFSDLPDAYLDCSNSNRYQEKYNLAIGTNSPQKLKKGKLYDLRQQYKLGTVNFGQVQINGQHSIILPVPNPLAPFPPATCVDIPSQLLRCFRSYYKDAFWKFLHGCAPLETSWVPQPDKDEPQRNKVPSNATDLNLLRHTDGPWEFFWAPSVDPDKNPLQYVLEMFQTQYEDGEPVRVQANFYVNKDFADVNPETRIFLDPLPPATYDWRIRAQDTCVPPHVDAGTSYSEGAGFIVEDDVCTDVDGDGYGTGCAESDCDDTRDNVHPGADEVCEDGVDNDCDGVDSVCVPGCDPPVGFFASCIQTAVSYKFYDAWVAGGDADMLGLPVDDGGTVFVHDWWGRSLTCTEDDSLCLQNFDGGEYGPNAIFFNPIAQQGDGFAYVVRSGFWQFYRWQDGPAKLGYPFNQETIFTCGNGEAVTYQTFQKGMLLWKNGSTQVDYFPGCTDPCLFYGLPSLAGSMSLISATGDFCATTSDCMDNDGDGYGVGVDCLGPDCDDSDASVHPATQEICGDGIDQDCDGADAVCVPQCPDGDNSSCQMVFVPAGKFVRGSCSERTIQNDGACTPETVGYYQFASYYESPVREITLGAYWIDTMEVTVSQYRSCVQSGACKLPPLNTSVFCNWNRSGHDNHPINCIGWYDGRDYCLSLGKRLPTEAEWEKAARGGCEFAGDPNVCEPGFDDRKYPWGNETPDCSRANFEFENNKACANGTAPVGSYPNGVSPYGVFDMAGNVAEWVQDSYDSTYYRLDYGFPDYSPDINPHGPTESSDRVLRGGSWIVSGPSLRLSLRGLDGPGNPYEYYGFRCAKSQ